MVYALSFSDVTVTDAHVGTPEQVVQIHFVLRNTGDQPLPANAAYIIAEGFGGDRIAEGSHWVDEEIAAGSAKQLMYQLQCDPGEWRFSLMAFRADQAWLADTRDVAHTVGGYAGAEHRQPQAPEGGAYLLTLVITQFEGIDGGVRVHYAARNDGSADAPPGTELIASLRGSDTSSAPGGTQDHVLESAIPVGETIHGYLTVMVDPGQYQVTVEGASGTNATPTYGEVTVPAP